MTEIAALKAELEKEQEDHLFYKGEFERANRLLRERGSSFVRTADGWFMENSDRPASIIELTGIMINIRAIEQDSAEKILRDIISAQSGTSVYEFRDRAKKLLEGK